MSILAVAIFIFFIVADHDQQRTNNHDHKLIKKMFQYQNKTHVGLFSLLLPGGY